MNRHICFVVNSRANYARIKSAILSAIAHPSLEVSVIVGASGVLTRFGNVAELIEKDGIKVDARVYAVVEGDNPLSMVKTTGLLLLDLAQEFARLKPHVVVTVADRYETIATAIAASYMNIPVAHTQGGEVTGSIDESVRHAITKLSHIHFPATEKAAQTLARLGENPAKIFLVGCPALDLVIQSTCGSVRDVLPKYQGVGAVLDLEKPYLLISQHPDTTEFLKARVQIEETLSAVNNLGIQAIWLWPNVDSGSDSISKRLREFRESELGSKILFVRNFSAEDYVTVLREAACVVGNSSSGIREASLLGTPAVNIGNRQIGRERGINVIDVNYEATEIANAIRQQVSRGKYPSSSIYGNGSSGQQIAEILSTVDLSIKKSLHFE
jgi:UDP-hydrolysing UDP-N-acetyl-D-glucosamine 2-epimerase